MRVHLFLSYLFVAFALAVLVGGCAAPQSPVAPPATREVAATVATVIVAPNPTAAPTQAATPTTAPTATPITKPTAAPSLTPVAIAKGQSVQVKVPAPSLKKSLLGDAPERTIAVYLPPSYQGSDKHYPVVYYLPGFGDVGTIGFPVQTEMDNLIGSGAIQEMIFVVANGISALDGSFYANSPVTGNWEDLIANDVVGYIDANYRTIPKAEARGISGHSMGGFGALSIAMHRPDVFGAVYSFSPGLFDENGLAESQMFAPQNAVKMFLSKQENLESRPEDQARLLMTTVGGDTGFAMAYGAAFAPNPDKKPPYIDYPYTMVDGAAVRDDAVWQRWENGFGGWKDKVQRYKDNLLSLRGLVFNCGMNDEFAWIPKGCVYLDEQLQAAAIPHKFVTHDGDHQGHLGEGVRELAIPFFSQVLVGEQ